MHTLVLSNKWDTHADSVIEAIEILGGSVVRINTEDMSGDQVSWSLQKDVVLIQTPEGRKVRVDNIHSVYLRRISPIIAPDLEPQYLTFVNDEFSVYIDSLETLLPKAIWFDSPRLRALADNKIRQLILAQQTGLKVPSTLVTNDPSQVKNLMHQGQVVYKTLYRPVLDFGEVGSSIVHTTLLDPSKILQYEEHIKACLGIYQLLVPKKYELRIYYINGYFISVKIDSQRWNESRIDWRKIDFDKLDYELVEIPSILRELLTNFMKTLRLRLGVFDVVVTPDDDYVFLEVNPDGNWLWLDNSLDTGVSELIAKAITFL